MIAPVWQQNKKGRMVYLPEAMKLLRFRSPGDYTEEILEAGDHYIPYGLDEAVFFLRKGGENLTRCSGSFVFRCLEALFFNSSTTSQTAL